MDSQYENTPRHPCDSHFPKDISALSWSFLLENWNKTNVYEMITHYTSCQQCRTVSNSVNSVNSVNSFNSVNSVNNVNSVNSVNSYSAVLPPSPMVFLISGRSASDLATLMAKFKLVCLNDVEDIDDFWQIALSGSGSGRDIGNIWSRNGQRALSSHMYNVQFKHRTQYMMKY